MVLIFFVAIVFLCDIKVLIFQTVISDVMKIILGPSIKNGPRFQIRSEMSKILIKT